MNSNLSKVDVAMNCQELKISRFCYLLCLLGWVIGIIIIIIMDGFLE